MSTQNISTKRTELSAAKRALLEQRLRGAGRTSREATAIPRRAERDYAPLSYVQQESLRLDQTGRVPSAYLGTALRFTGALNLAALEQSYNESLRRHESLRTNFGHIGEQAVQLVRSFTPQTLTVHDLSDEPARAEQARQLIARELTAPFDLERDPLFRFKVIKLAADEYALGLVMHHMISDFLSLGLLVQELGLHYEAFANGQASPLPDLPVQYGDWAAWQRQQVATGALAAQLAYWRTRLQGCPPVLELPCARQRPHAQTFAGAVRQQALPAALTDPIRELSRQQAVSLYTTLLTAFNVLIHHYTQRTDIVLGRGIPGRTRGEVEKLVGCFVNMLVLRTDVSGNPSFLDLMKRVSATVNEAYANQDVPFAVLAETFAPERDPRCPPLVQVAFNLYTAPVLQPVTGARLSVLDLGDARPQTDIALFQDMIFGLNDTGHTLIAEVKYNPDLFDEPVIEQMLAHYHALLAAVIADPARPYKSCSRRHASSARAQSWHSRPVAALTRPRRYTNAPNPLAPCHPHYKLR